MLWCYLPRMCGWISTDPDRPTGRQADRPSDDELAYLVCDRPRVAVAINMLKHKLAHTLTTNVSNSNIREKVSDFTYAHDGDAWDAYDERYLTPLAVCE